MNCIRMRRRGLGIAASVLAIAAAGPAAASARPNFEPQPAVQTSTTNTHGRQGATGVPPSLSRSQASELAAIDRAKARAADDQVSPKGPYSTAALTTAAIPVASPTLKAPGTGFDWGDAAVGAGVTAAIGILIAAASVAVRHRSEPRHP